jgi:PAS domain S-box-containing protein
MANHMYSQGNGTLENGGYGPLSPSLGSGAGHSGECAQADAFAIVTLDRSETVTSWNAEAERLFGYSAKRAIGKPFYHFIDLESLTPGSVEWELLTAYYRGASTCTRQYTHKNGRRFRATADIVPIWDGEFVGYQLTFTSIARVEEWGN